MVLNPFVRNLKQSFSCFHLKEINKAHVSFYNHAVFMLCQASSDNPLFKLSYWLHLAVHHLRPGLTSLNTTSVARICAMSAEWRSVSHCCTSHPPPKDFLS